MENHEVAACKITNNFKDLLRKYSDKITTANNIHIGINSGLCVNGVVGYCKHQNYTVSYTNIIRHNIQHIKGNW